MTNTPGVAIKVAANQSANGPRIDKWLGVDTYTGWCLRSVRTCYAVDAFDFTKNNGRGPLAHEAFDYAQHKHPTTDPASIPRGVPVYWKGGSSGAGHIAISTGNGYCWSTDIVRPGYFDHVPIATIRAKWGMTLLGWTEDLNGVRVYTPPTEPAKETVVAPTAPKVAGLYAQITSLANQIIAATTAGTPNSTGAYAIRKISHQHDGSK